MPPPPPRKAFGRDFEIDLGAELDTDYALLRRRSTGAKVALVVLGVLLCLAVGVGVGYLVTHGNRASTTPRIDTASDTVSLRVTHEASGLSEAERAVQRRLSAVALDEAADLVDEALAQGRSRFGRSDSSTAEAGQPTTHTNRHRRDSRSSRSRYPIPFASEPALTIEQRMAPLLDIEQTDPYSEQR